jgi:hypothetical protein
MYGSFSEGSKQRRAPLNKLSEFDNVFATTLRKARNSAPLRPTIRLFRVFLPARQAA